MTRIARLTKNCVFQISNKSSLVAFGIRYRDLKFKRISMKSSKMNTNSETRPIYFPLIARLSRDPRLGSKALVCDRWCSKSGILPEGTST